MSADGNNAPPPFSKKETNGLLNELLDFGPDHPDHHTQVSRDAHERIQRLVAQLKEINQRIDKLTEKI